MTLRQLIFIGCMAIATQSAAQATVGDTVSLYFEIGDQALNKNALAKIDSLLYQDIINSQSRLTIVGYADNLGTEEKNKTLSENRSQNVLSYLAQMGIRKNNVTLCIGKGEVARTVRKENGYPADRRVDIVINTRVKSAKNSKTPQPVTKKQVATPPLPAPVKTLVSTTPSAKSDSTILPLPGSSIDINTLKPGETMVLDKIYFYPGRHMVRQESMPELEKLYNTLETNPNLKIQIEGHVCCVNSVDALDEDTFELALSKNRARFIYDYLIKKGIAEERLRYRGFGKTKPAVKVERNEDDQNRNRRVEIRVLK